MTVTTRNSLGWQDGDRRRSRGYFRSLALCSDGTLVAWGANNLGQLGNNSTNRKSRAPVAVYTSGVLVGKTVVAVSGRKYPLCGALLGRDGGLLGLQRPRPVGKQRRTTPSLVPVLVDTTGALSGKTVTAVRAGEERVLALALRTVQWQPGAKAHSLLLGNNSSASAPVPVIVSTTGALFRKIGHPHCDQGLHQLGPLCSDGQVAAWGRDDFGQLGDNNPTNFLQPSPRQCHAGTLAGEPVGFAGDGKCAPALPSASTAPSPHGDQEPLVNLGTKLRGTDQFRYR